MAVNLVYKNYLERVNSINVDHEMLSWVHFFMYKGSVSFPLDCDLLLTF